MFNMIAFMAMSGQPTMWSSPWQVVMWCTMYKRRSRCSYTITAIILTGL